MRLSSGERLDCGLFATYSLSKYLDCPLVNATQLDVTSDSDSIDIPAVNVTWKIQNNYEFIQFPFRTLCIDYCGTCSNDLARSSQGLSVTSSGQLFIRRVLREMRFFTFECSVMDETTSNWSAPLQLQPLAILNYRKFSSCNNT